MVHEEKNKMDRRGLRFCRSSDEYENKGMVSHTGKEAEKIPEKEI
jgi:hypothetical protein